MIFASKSEARKYSKGLLRSMDRREISELSKKAADLAAGLPEFSSSKLLLLFLSMQDEIDTAPLIDICFSLHIRAAAPRIAGNDIEFVELDKNYTQWDRDAFGIPEPPSDKPCVSDEALIDRSIAFVPGLLFDRQGGRLGRGKGFYDRFLHRILNNLRNSKNAGSSFIPIGYCFERQIADKVPVESADIRVPLLVSERAVVTCSPENVA
jgi:5-formyltetrahydrofolate cyclo-ligase